VCQITCKTCDKPIGEEEEAVEVRQGFIERADFTPEQELAFYHANCFPHETLTDQ